ncbi:transcriptional regulator [Jiangella ureilytica]|uniref:Transcriptional regulator n=1 Tax=Jiangella ureilytica TaxID=2530374 RepID=A0A4R4RSS7_9ACTN|nr:zf-TFIIB domain-containing protein [Jiangella ureilytica]TDC53088.1 transcriptional regulator [Jiangella ureilytica]
MTCPKCNGQMKTYDRLGVHVEQCENCKGIFLDKGELEQIVAAEEQYNAPPPPLDYSRQAPPPQQPYQQPQQPYRGRPDSPAPYGRGYSDSPSPYGYGGRKRKKSFLDQLFD